MKQTIGAGLLSCADNIWDTADTLRGAGIKAKRQLMNSGDGGTKIQLSLDDVRHVWLAVPPLDVQIEIANFLDQRLRKIARQITLIDRLDDLLQQQRKAIIYEAVTGKLDLSLATWD